MTHGAFLVVVTWFLPEVVAMRTPLLFLSHCKANIEIVKRIMTDLQACKIRFWFDEEEIEAGDEWQEKIFGEALPSCDGIFAYLTPEALKSKIMKKELDVASLDAIGRENAGRFFYVNAPETRSLLRSDLRLLQLEVWNDNNHREMVARAGTRIWRWWAEQLVADALVNEKNARLSAELRITELERSAADSLFSQSELTLFDIIVSKLERKVPFRVSTSLHKTFKDNAGTTSESRPGPNLKGAVPALQLIQMCQLRHSRFSRDIVSKTIAEGIELPEHLLGLEAGQHAAVKEVNPEFQLTPELLRYGLLTRETIQVQFAPSEGKRPPSFALLGRESLTQTQDWYYWSDRMGHFCIWLESQGRGAEHIEISDLEVLGTS